MLTDSISLFSQRRIITSLALLLMVILPFTLVREVLAAATPTATLTLPSSGLLGESLSFSVTFANTAPGASETGYGPYIDLILPATGADGNDGITFTSATYLGQSVTSTVLTFNASGQATHPYALTNTGIPVVVTGTSGDQLVVLQLPFGSFTRDQPPITVQINASVSNLADVETALTVRTRGGFQYGGDALNNPTTDPSIIGSYAASTFTPKILSLTKTYLGPESETATGPNYPRQYRVTVDIPTGQTLTNLDLIDLLPANMQFVRVDSTTIRGGAATTTAVSTPSTSVPGGNLTRRFASVTGTSATNDAELLFTFYIPLSDITPNPVINATSGDAVTSINDAKTQGNWTPLDTRDAATLTSSDVTANDHTLTDRSIATQKSVSLAVDTGPTGNSPGDTLLYTLQVQISDFFSFQDVVINDTVSDGQRFDSTFTPRLTVNGNGYTLAAAPMNAANYTVTPRYTGGGGPTPSDGTTRIAFRLSDELVSRGQSDKFIGGCVPVAGTGGGAPDCASFNDGPTTATLTFRTVIQDSYTDNFPSGNNSLNEGDSVSNTETVSANLLSVIDNATLTGQPESDNSSASVKIPNGTLTKSIYAINGSTTLPSPVRVTAGDRVTYRVRYQLQTGDFEQFSLTDYLPLPAFRVADADADGVAGPTWSFDSTGATAPPAGQWKRGPADTQFARSGRVPTLTTDNAANSLRFAYATYDDATNSGATIDLLFTVTASSDKFVDGLFLTNQVRQTDQNTQNAAQSQDAIVQLQITEPVLTLRKGIIATNGTATTFAPTTVGPVTFSAPGGGCPRFAGTVTSTDLTTSPINSNLSGVDAGDLVTFAIVVENTGSGLNGAFDVRVRDDLPTGFAVPSGGLNLCVTDGTGAAIATVNVSGGTGLLSQGIELVDPGPTATPTGGIDPFSASNGRNIAIITFDLQLQTSVAPAAVINNTATLFNYAAQEGRADFTPTDLTDGASSTIATPTNTKSIVSTSEAHTTTPSPTTSANPARLAVGEIVRFRLAVQIPEGTSPICNCWMLCPPV